MSGDNLHDARFPGGPRGYRAARDRLLRSEAELCRMTEAVAEQRRNLPPGRALPTDFVFDCPTSPSGSTSLP
jgi:predicted dithiol-disulfide oxidoreductase (DUF899 family)